MECTRIMRHCWIILKFSIYFLFFSQNLLFTDKTEKAQLKLVDFGFAKIKGSQPMQTPCFTLSYAAPEILRNATGENAPSSYDESVDIWSLGVILVNMITLIIDKNKFYFL